MSFFNRIQQIEQKISGLENRMGGSSSSFQQAGVQARSEATSTQEGGAVNFENLVNTLADDQKFSPKASSIAGVGAVATKAGRPEIEKSIAQASAKYGVDAELIRAVITQESSFNSQATSHCGAQGLMQLMPGTAKDLGVEDAYDAHQNVMGGTRYLSQLMDRFDGNLTKVLAGYNAGPGAVEEHDGIPPYAETRDYVSKVMDYYQEYKTKSL